MYIELISLSLTGWHTLKNQWIIYLIYEEKWHISVAKTFHENLISTPSKILILYIVKKNFQQLSMDLAGQVEIIHENICVSLQANSFCRLNIYYYHHHNFELRPLLNRHLKESAHMLGYNDLPSRPSIEFNTKWKPMIKKARWKKKIWIWALVKNHT